MHVARIKTWTVLAVSLVREGRRMSSCSLGVYGAQGVAEVCVCSEVEGHNVPGRSVCRFYHLLGRYGLLQNFNGGLK